MDNSRRAKMDELAGQLATAWPNPGTPVHLDRDLIPANRAEAYFVQDQMHAKLGLELAGWKVGATSPTMREIDGHEDVIPGRIFSVRTYLGTRHSLPIAQFLNARAETEFAFRLTQTPALRETPWTASEMAAIMVLHPAIEIVGNRFRIDAASKAENSLLTVADNGGGIGFIFGDPVDDWQDIDFQNHLITLCVSDGPAAQNFLGEMRCIPAQAAADLVNHLAGRGEALRAGDFLSTGAATVPQPFAAGDVVKADFGGLGHIELNF